MRTSYISGVAGVSCGILRVTDDSATYASPRGIEFVLPRPGLKMKVRKLTKGCVLSNGEKQYLVYMSMPVAGCPSLNLAQADHISKAYLGGTRTITIPSHKAEDALSAFGVILGVLSGGGDGSSAGLLAGAFKARHSRKALKDRLQ